MKKIFLTFLWLLFSSPLFSTHSPCIIMLKGACSSGKSSICEEIKSLNIPWSIIDEDEIYMEMLVEFISHHFPEYFQSISKVIAPQNRFHAIKRKEILFIKSATKANKKKAAQAISELHEILNSSSGTPFLQEFNHQLGEHILEKISKTLEGKKNVLIDSWVTTQEKLQSRFPEVPVLKVLVFCPLPKALKFLEKRNEEASETGNLKSRRFYDQLLLSYDRLYCFTTDPANSISQCKIETIHELFEEIAPHVIQTAEHPPRLPFTRTEMTLYQLQKYHEAFISDQVCHHEKSLYIQPKQKYSYFLDTSKSSPKKLAIKLVDKLHDLAHAFFAEYSDNLRIQQNNHEAYDHLSE